MSEEVRVVNEKTGGAKGSKDERFDLIPYEALAEIARVYGMGAKKYDPHNWRKGYDWGLSYAALMRHITAFWQGEDLDPESGLPHVAHAGWHCLTLLTFMKEHGDLDDRYTTIKAAKDAEASSDLRRQLFADQTGSQIASGEGVIALNGQSVEAGHAA